MTPFYLKTVILPSLNHCFIEAASTQSLLSQDICSSQGSQLLPPAPMTSFQEFPHYPSQHGPCLAYFLLLLIGLTYEGLFHHVQRQYYYTSLFLWLWPLLLPTYLPCSAIRLLLALPRSQEEMQWLKNGTMWTSQQPSPVGKPTTSNSHHFWAKPLISSHQQLSNWSNFLWSSCGGRFSFPSAFTSWGVILVWINITLGVFVLLGLPEWRW